MKPINDAASIRAFLLTVLTAVLAWYLVNVLSQNAAAAYLGAAAWTSAAYCIDQIVETYR